MGTVYVITSGEHSDYRIVRVYLDRDQAYDIVEKHNSFQASRTVRMYDRHHQWEVEEWDVGPESAFEGPVWEAHWQDTYSWGADRTPEPERMTLASGQRVWHEGNDPGEAEVTVYQPNNNRVNVIGHDRTAVNRLLIDTVAAIKAKRVSA